MRGDGGKREHERIDMIAECCGDRGRPAFERDMYRFHFGDFPKQVFGPDMWRGAMPGTAVAEFLGLSVCEELLEGLGGIAGMDCQHVRTDRHDRYHPQVLGVV